MLAKTTDVVRKLELSRISLRIGNIWRCSVSSNCHISGNRTLTF